MAASQAPDVLDRHFLELRCGLLDFAAALDRLERAAGFDAVKSDPRLDLIHQGLRILQSSGADRAERIQILFSDPYQENWQEQG
jgi:hypothetical protein